MVSHVPFIREEFALMVGKKQWIVLTYLAAKELPGLRLISPGAKEDQDWRPRCIDDYIFTYTNVKYLPIAVLSAIQYGWDLDCLIREVLIADTSLGPVYILKADVINEIYCIVLRPEDAPKLGLVLPSEKNGEDLLAIPLTPPMGWNPPPPPPIYYVL